MRIESYANQRCLTAGANPPDTVTLQERTDNLNQHWRLVAHAERGNDFYLVSVVHPRYTLASPTTSKATTGWWA
ncbi:predicted protein [Streptomyces viridochromogenes DSM 40736]|uniref:Predicted protein n=1 Tax=Streptomyces viridochromogenes (strain DSM 40736 / JCM 4977 / BCRC 1201 / Tue 494) TaxID=591159 RepID=D9X1W0_STRVT|nr:hypothetical protein [Streptomyces viridochromogenes]EFL29532.1 predicted protein [Streptomyces viridochromogenes DSM 40736]